MHKTEPRLRRYACSLRRTGTDAERWLWRYLRGRRLGGYKFRRQVPIGNYIVDFLCKEKRLVLEIDGSQRQVRADYDRKRTRYLESLGLHVVRYWNNQVLEQGEAVLADILKRLEQQENG